MLTLHTLSRTAKRAATGIAAALALAAVSSAPVGARPINVSRSDDGDGGFVACDTGVRKIGIPYLNGLPIINNQIELAGEQVKILVEYGTCGELDITSALPFEWTVRGPGNSAVPVTDGSTLRPHIRPSATGTYTATLTYCPQTCPNLNVGILPQPASVSFFVGSQIPPETTPILPPAALAETTPRSGADNTCASNEVVPNEVDTPQLVMVERFNGANNYALLEGQVEKTSIAYNDNELNHESHDIGVGVRPDPAYRHLMVAGRREMEIEWESNYFPGPMRPSAGDRISAFGFHVYDCHHSPIATEIHPPVLTAVHRMRAVRIPDDWPQSAPLGTGIWAPGVITDIWVNARNGEMTSNCSASGLHQTGDGDCIESPHSLQRVFTFNIYLPRSPQKRAANLGIAAPPVPLHSRVDDVSGASQCPVTIAQSPDGDFLIVNVDLSNFSDESCGRRVVAAWALPSADNWGLERWKVGISSLNVSDDHDVGTDGDWVFWASVNNRDQEWTRLLNGDSVGEGTYDFGGRPWETGSADAARSLGPHLLLFNPSRFPGPSPQIDLTRSLEIHTSGYDEEFWDDQVGKVLTIFTPNPAVTAVGAPSPFSEESSTSDYRLNLSYERLGAVPAARLAPAGQRLVDAYSTRGGRCTILRNDLCVLSPFTSTFEAWHPSQEPTRPGGPEIDWSDHPAFEGQEAEPGIFTQIPLHAVRKWVVSRQRREPARVNRFLMELREEFEAVKGTRLEQEYARSLPSLSEAVPTDLWRANFSRLGALQADLAVSQLSMSPPGALAGEAVVFAARIQNRGLGAAAPFDVRLSIDGRQHSIVAAQGLAPGDSMLVEIPVWRATRGAHSVRISADATARITEPNERDNDVERRFSVSAGRPGGQDAGPPEGPGEVVPPDPTPR